MYQNKYIGIMILVTGAGGLIGYSVSTFFLKKKHTVIGIENNQRQFLFGQKGSVERSIEKLKKLKNFLLYDVDILNKEKISKIFDKYDFDLVVHAAAQPSHDWSASNPILDFNINTVGTINLLEAVRLKKKNCKFIFLSTNKVYGDSVNYLKYFEKKKRYEVEKKFKNGFNESLSIDNTKHSPFGASKLSADIYVQEYGKYFGLKTCCLRAGCLTGENHSGVELHGFLSYLFKCAYYKKKYNVYGYKGKQVRDNLSALDVSIIINEIYKKFPKNGEVFNIGGGQKSNISILEAIHKLEILLKRKINYSIFKENRSGDHKFWVTDMKKFKNLYKNWKIKLDIDNIFVDMLDHENSFQKRKLFFT
jgi:CDP-paratose 2-epimerase